MVVSFKLYEFISACEASRKSDGAHTGFCSTAYHSDEVNVGNHTHNQFSHFNFKLRWSTERSRVQCFFSDCIYNRAIGMSKNHRTPGCDVINVFVAIGIIEVCATGFFHEKRCSSHTFECPYRRVDSAWNALLCPVEKCLTFCGIHRFTFFYPSNLTASFAK